MKPRLLMTLLILLVCTVVYAREDRHICQKAFESIENKTEVFKTGADWFPYPAYSDRDGWDRLTGDFKESLIKGGQKYLRYKWQVIPELFHDGMVANR